MSDVVFLIGAILFILFAWRVLRKVGHYDGALSGRELIERADWREFERLTAQALRGSRFSISESPGEEVESDGGVDLVAARNGYRYVVQCKCWKHEVGVEVVRAIYGVMAARGDHGCMVASSGRFTKSAWSWARGKPITLIHGTALARMLDGESLESVVSAPSTAERREVRRRERTGQGLKCPECGRDMVLRRARQGTYAGQEFWGCIRYPNCRGIRNA